MWESDLEHVQRRTNVITRLISDLHQGNRRAALGQRVAAARPRLPATLTSALFQLVGIRNRVVKEEQDLARRERFDELCDALEGDLKKLAQGPHFGIINKASGLGLDVDAWNTDNAGRIHQWQFVAAVNQQWALAPTGDGFYALLARHSGKCLDFGSAPNEEGGVVHQWDYWAGPNQQFLITENDDSTYRLSPRHNLDMCLDADWSGTDGAPVVQWWWHGGDNQRWWLKLLP